uniref:Uncharacterized protein n=1 Tax=viral metagenome TaxID=1070528 RepID=A0A6M3JHG6_9ZZZZ
MKYCEIATKLLKINIVCGKDCPMYGTDCPQLIMQDANDKIDEINKIAVERAVAAILRSVNAYSKS